MSETNGNDRFARLTSLALLACTAIAFWPAARWLAAQTAARQQILQSALILGAAALVILRENRQALKPVLAAGNRALILLGLSYALALPAWLLPLPVLWLPALVLALAGVIHVLFGDTGARILRPVLLGFAGFILIVLAFPRLDWPLRQLAGTGAARCLLAIGLAPRLAIVIDHDLKLLLAVGREVFEVATECNGFGLITSSALLAFVLGCMSRRRWGDLFLLMLSGMTIGFFGNVLRIMFICLLAPVFPGHYHAVHETVGTLILWAGLGATAWLAWPGRRPVAGC